MTDGMAKSAIDGMRTLTSHIDRSIEALIEAHGFSFMEMNATNRHAFASFDYQDTQERPPWQLTLSHSTDGEMMVSLKKMQEDRQQVSLSILIGTDAARTLAEGVGLAVSFVAMSGQLKDTAHQGAMP